MENENTIEEGYRQKKRLRSSLLFWGQNLFNILPNQLFCPKSSDDLCLLFCLYPSFMKKTLTLEWVRGSGSDRRQTHRQHPPPSRSECWEGERNAHKFKKRNECCVHQSITPKQKKKFYKLMLFFFKMIVSQCCLCLLFHLLFVSVFPAFLLRSPSQSCTPRGWGRAQYI